MPLSISSSAAARLPGVVLRPDGRDLQFQVVAVPVDEPDALPALLVLLVLAVQHVVHGFQLPVEPVLPQLVLLQRQHQHPRQVHQRADIKHREGGLAILGEGQIAHRKGHRRHDHRAEQRPPGDLHPPLGPPVAEIVPRRKAVHKAVHHRQQHQGGHRPGAAPRPEHTVDLPFQAGGKLRQNEGPGAGVPPPPGDGSRSRGRGRRTSCPPPPPMQGIHHTSGTSPVRCKNTPSTASAPGADGRRGPLAEPPGQRQHIEQAGQPTRDLVCRGISGRIIFRSQHAI